MEFELKEFVSRLSEAVGEDSQGIIASKLHMTQGNVSKIFSGNQLPKLDTIYSISREYNVSVDWLLGLSEEKRIIQFSSDELSYTAAVDATVAIENHGGKIQENPREDEIQITVKDPLFFALLRKSRTLRAADYELYESWKKEKLSQFMDKPLLWQSSWTDIEDIDLLVGEAVTEAHWLKVYEIVKKHDDDMAEFMGSDPGIFDE